MGFTHSLMAALILASIIYLISKRNKSWFLGVLVEHKVSRSLATCEDVGGSILCHAHSLNNVSKF